MAMATSTMSPSSNFLYQVLTLPTKNKKLFLPLLTIITLITFISILFYFFFLQPLSADIALKAQALADTDPTSPDYSILIAAIQKETKELLVKTNIYVVISLSVDSFLTIITFFAAAVTYSGELVTLGELLVKAKRNMKGPIITHFYGMFLSFLCSLPLVLLTVLFLLFIKKLGSYTFIMFSILALVLLLLALLLLLYLSIVWPLSTTVSVVETDCYGPRAFKRATKLAKEKKMTGFLIILSSFLPAGALYSIYRMINSSSTASVLVLGFFLSFFGELMAMYRLVAFVIYYFECKKSQGDQGEEEEEEEEEEEAISGGFVYKRVPTKAIHVDEELP